MKLSFYKYHGTANDFIIVDDRDEKYTNLSADAIRLLCDRRVGIGADGLIFLQNHAQYDFKMVYYNADGYEGSMCGNGGRCIVAFANFLGLVSDRVLFEAIDGMHEAKILSNGQIALKMNAVNDVEVFNEDFVLDTGSPHYVKFSGNVDQIDVYEEGKKIRNSDRFIDVGINVNFVSKTPEGLHVRTFERGVEDETYSCGTGVVASAISYAVKHELIGYQEIDILTKGGKLSVHFNGDDDFNNIWLIGPTENVYKGVVHLNS